MGDMKILWEPAGLDSDTYLLLFLDNDIKEVIYDADFSKNVLAPNARRETKNADQTRIGERTKRRGGLSVREREGPNLGNRWKPCPAPTLTYRPANSKLGTGRTGLRHIG